MRLVGRISSWNDDKGFGFALPHGGGDRVFVHIKAFQFGSRRPVDGDLISYSVAKDSRGRTNAVDVRYAGQKIAERKPQKPMPRLAIAIISLVIILISAFLGFLPTAFLFGYALLSCLSYIMYTLDKVAAGKNMQRTPESTLHFIDLLGGWPGALIAQQQSRHKTVKASFQSIFWFTVLLNIAVVVWLVSSGTAKSVIASVFGG